MTALLAIGYVRVSTDRQAETGQGLKVQERAVRDFCKHQGFRVLAILRDEGVSGTIEATERPGLSEALELLRDGGTKVLVIPSLDRLARTLTVQEAALAHVWRLKARVFAADSGEILQDDPEDPMRTGWRQMMGVFNQIERGMINARLRRGRREKGERGGYAFGSPPYGQRKGVRKSVNSSREEKVLVPNEDEAKVIAYARRLRGEGKSLREICVALDEKGYKPKRGERWDSGVLSRILKRTE